MDRIHNDVLESLSFLKWAYNKVYYIDDINYDQIYPYSNENLSMYYDYVDLNNKKVLTITSSFDHALHAILAGATKIDSFDKNRLCKYYASLKLSIIKKLNHEEFIDFNSNFKKIRKGRDINLNYFIKDLNEDEKLFWDDFLLQSENKKIKRLFKNDGYNYPLKTNLVYFDEDKYEELRCKLNSVEINFYDMEIDNIDTINNGLYDAIFLSNISDFFSLNGLTKALNKCLSLLNKNGVIYDYHKFINFPLIKNNDLELEQIIKTNKIKNTNYNECVLIYRKK